MGRFFTPLDVRGSAEAGWLTEAHKLFAPRCVHKTCHLSAPRPPRACGRECNPPLSLINAAWQIYPAQKKEHRAFPEMCRDAHWWACPSWLLHWLHDFGENGHLQILWLSQMLPLEWSASSDPVDIIITGECGQTSPFCSLCHRRSGVQSSISPEREWQACRDTHKPGRRNKPERGVNTEGKREQSACHVLRRRHSWWETEGTRTWKNDQWRKMYQSRDPGNSLLRQPTMIG